MMGGRLSPADLLPYFCRCVLFDVNICVTGDLFVRVAQRDDIDEKRDEYTDERIEYAVEGEAGDAGIGAVCDGDGKESDAGDIGQCAFAHEIGQKKQWCDREQFFQVSFFQDSRERIFLDGFRDIINGRMQNEISRYCSVGSRKILNSRMMKRTAIPVKPPISVPTVRFMPTRNVLLISGCKQMIVAIPE